MEAGRWFVDRQSRSRAFGGHRSRGNLDWTVHPIRPGATVASSRRGHWSSLSRRLDRFSLGFPIVIAVRCALVAGLTHVQFLSTCEHLQVQVTAEEAADRSVVIMSLGLPSASFANRQTDTHRNSPDRGCSLTCLLAGVHCQRLYQRHSNNQVT